MTFTTCTFLHVVVILRCKSQAGKDHTRLVFRLVIPRILSAL